MLNIDTNTMRIGITRGDSASITFGAKKKDGTDWNPQYTTDTLTFAVAKKWGGEPMMEITNTYDENPYTEVEIDSTTFNADKTKYYTESGGTYTQCLATDSYDADETYYVKDYANFWTITIPTSKWLDDDGNDKFKFADYVFDVQVGTTSGAITIIGQTDELSPTFRVLGEVAPE